MSDQYPSISSMTEVLGKDENRTAKQTQILEAAVELISEKGYTGTSTSEIAKRAGVAEGTIFRHYRTKKELLLAITNPVIMHFTAPVLAEKFVKEVFHGEHRSFKDFLYVFIENRFAFVRANVPLIKIVVQELAFHPEIQEAFKQASLEKVLPEMHRTLNFYKTKGQLQDIPNERIIRMIAPTILGFLFTRFIIQPDQEWDDEMEIRQTVTYICNGIGGQAPRPVS